ncbi:hypothetical protein RhiJN_07897 [Ceratobasidium sp. AG-Ba]|nr:hypothetical protein RhiJN_07897 [Ceratobasidium sp. AG-Ba]
MASPETEFPTVSPPDTFLIAKTEHYLGRFCITLDQIKHHGLQRSVKCDWVRQLHQHFLDVGIDRAAHPIKVVLARPDDLAIVMQAQNHGQCPWLPRDIPVLVYSGQHRVHACQQIEDPKEHWWSADVYSSGLVEKYPAEFVTSMHITNETEHRLVPTDAERFLSLHHLNQLRQQSKISSETCQVNQARILRSGANEGTRRGLSNLLLSDDLAESIAGALRLQHLHPAFNAGSWGKKLVKGRFFKLVACLVDEMVEQCRLLVQDQAEPASNVFLLSAASCSWSSLEKAIKKKNHVWNNLPGGAASALERIKTRTPHFITYLNPVGTDSWTFSDTLLLPSVLTSELVAKSLRDMYTLMQHVVSVAAGQTLLERYTANAAHTVPSPGIANKDDYKRLLNKSKDWWELFRMFRISPLVGQQLRVPKVFGEMDPNQKSRILAAIQEKRSRDNEEGEPEKAVRKTRLRMRSRSPSLDLELVGPDDSTSQEIRLPQPERSCKQTGATSSRTCTTARVDSCQLNLQTDDQSLDDGSMPNQAAQMQQEDKEQLETLLNTVDSFNPSAIESMRDLLSHVVGLGDKPYAGRVLNTMCEKLPVYIARAQHAQAVVDRTEEEQ